MDFMGLDLGHLHLELGIAREIVGNGGVRWTWLRKQKQMMT